MTELQSFQLIKEVISNKQKNKTLRIAINGIEGTGKTTFAIKLCSFLKSKGLNAYHVSIDGFHFNKEKRYSQGRDSALGYYQDSYDELGFVEKVLISSQAENPTITEATHDLETDEYLNIEPIKIPNDSIIITDGAYLFKANYRKHWDIKIYLKTDFEIALVRGIKRDEKNLGGFEKTKQKYLKRYHKASQIYIQENDPESIADIVIENSEFKNLKVLKNKYLAK